MCDYSLHGIKNRLVIEGESLVVNLFETGSKGLASVTDLEPVKLGRVARLVNRFFPGTIDNPAHRLTAICVPPGARLRLSGIPASLRKKYGVGETEDVTFTQVTSEPFRYRDAFRFKSGAAILIQKFDECLRVEVLQLALIEEPAHVPTIQTERRMSANA